MAEYPSAEVFELIAVFSRKAGTDYEKLAQAILTAPPQRNNNGCQNAWVLSYIIPFFMLRSASFALS